VSSGTRVTAPWKSFQTRDAGADVFRQRTWFGRGIARCTRFYLDVAYRMAPWSGQLDALVDSAAGDPVRTARIRQLVRDASGRAPLTDRVLASRVVLDTPVFDEDGGVLWSSDHYAVFSEVDVFGRTTTDRASRASREPRTPRGASRTPTG